ncbi:unnamed protein product [Clavelina lepadiformis]|uniref:Uncharacterized protein n=1 Tax=Clavelina lepadiformis TaxID=159417 RepID=A0ABP0FXI3_CLALP
MIVTNQFVCSGCICFLVFLTMINLAWAVPSPSRGGFDKLLKKLLNLDNPVFAPDEKPLISLMSKKRIGPKSETCNDAGEWLVYKNDEPACVKPLWEDAYDPRFCDKASNSGQVFCNCPESHRLGMIRGVDTCINKANITHNGMCSLKPCPPEYKCDENEPGFRFDCVSGDGTAIPTLYNDEKKIFG